MRIRQVGHLAILILWILLAGAAGAADEAPPDPATGQEGPAVAPDTGTVGATGKASGPAGGEPIACDPTQTAMPWPESLWPRDVLGALWSLSEDECRLARAALLAIAFLVSLLTVIATWEVLPPPVRARQASRAGKYRQMTEAGGPEPSPAAAAESPAPVSAKPGLSSLSAFQNNFGRTVLSGLGGLVAVTFVDDSLLRVATIDAKAHYLVLYVVFFLSLLALSAFVQGFVEALRSRVSVAYVWHARDTGGRVDQRWWPRARATAARTARRCWSWLLSWQSSALIFCESALNVIQGRSLSQGAGFHQAIVDLHRSQVRAAERVRAEVDRAVLDALRRPDAKAFLNSKSVASPNDEDTRTCISVFDTVRQSLFYVAWERGSAWRDFTKESVAGFVASSGEARWVKRGSPTASGGWSERFENYQVAQLEIPGGSSAGKEGLTIEARLENRPSPDYEAFLMLPIPWSRRGGGGGYRPAALHIAFRKAEYLDALWDGLELPPGKTGEPNFAQWQRLLYSPPKNEAPVAAGTESLLHIKDPILGAVLHQAVEVLGEMLRSFDPRVFEEDILPNLDR